LYLIKITKFNNQNHGTIITNQIILCIFIMSIAINTANEVPSTGEEIYPGRENV